MREGEPRPEKPDALPVAVVQQIDNSWELVVFHNNTANIVEEIGESIPLAEFKKMVAPATGNE